MQGTLPFSVGYLFASVIPHRRLLRHLSRFIRSFEYCEPRLRLRLLLLDPRRRT